MVNDARIQAGFSRLSEYETLGRVAMAYSRCMATEGFYGHVDPQASDRIATGGYLAQMSVENIARGSLARRHGLLLLGV